MRVCNFRHLAIGFLGVRHVWVIVKSHVFGTHIHARLRVRWHHTIDSTRYGNLFNILRKLAAFLPNEFTLAHGMPSTECIFKALAHMW